MKKFAFSGIWPGILDVWCSGQILLPDVIRWFKHVKDEQFQVRKQNCLQHSYSVCISTIILTSILKRYMDLDSELILTCFVVHDHGEGETKKDTMYINKTVTRDVQEYLAFEKRFKNLSEDVFKPLQKAFLLQFCLEPSDSFPEEAQKVMQELAKDNYNEALVFELIERWDYILYALEQYNKFQNEKILVHVLRSHMSRLSEIADIFPGFKKEIWKDEVVEKFKDFLVVHEGEWIEKINKR